MEEPRPLTLIELKKRIDSVLESNERAKDLKVVIPNNKYGVMGGTPSTSVITTSAGFDWDTDCFFIHPENKMIEKPII